MDTLSTLITSKSNCSSFKTIYSTILCIATFSSLFLLRYSPLILWFAANAIIFSVYKLSSSRHPNHSDPQADSVHPILASLPLDRWHDYLSPHAEPGPREKEVITHVNTVEKDDKKVSMNEKNMAGNTCKAIMMRCSDYLSSPAEAPGLREKEVTHAYTVGEEDQKVTKEKNMDDTWKAIMMRRSRASARKPSLKKSDTWERSQRCLQRADEV